MIALVVWQESLQSLAARTAAVALAEHQGATVGVRKLKDNNDMFRGGAGQG